MQRLLLVNHARGRMGPLVRMMCQVLIVFGGSLACASHVASPAPVVSAPIRLTLTCFGPRQALLASGDYAQFALGLLGGERGLWSCVRARDSSLVRWSSSDTSVAQISAGGLVHARSPGKTMIRAEYRGHETEREVRVIRPVRALVWKPATATIVVGDTLRLEAIAGDSAGAPVERLLPLAVGEVEEQGAELVSFDPEGGVLIVGVRPGRLVLVAELAHRFDTAVVIVRER